MTIRARLFITRSPGLVHWSAPELLRVNGPDVPVERMGRMIDPYLIEEKDDLAGDVSLEVAGG